jgi:hypothetical protein
MHGDPHVGHRGDIDSLVGNPLMKILQICSARQLGGGERHLADLANGLARRHVVGSADEPRELERGGAPLVAERSVRGVCRRGAGGYADTEQQLASKQEQISRDMMTLQAAEQNRSAKISSLTQPAAVRVAPRRNIAKLVHSEAPKPTAESLPLQPPAPETPSPADQPPRPPLPLSAPPTEASSSAH